MKIVDALLAGLLWALGFYIPPPPLDADPQMIMKNRWANSAGIVGSFVGLGAIFAWIFGWLSFGQQYALASDVMSITGANSAKIAATDVKLTTISAQINMLVILSTKSSIDTQVKNRCLALRAKNQPDLDSANNQLVPLLDSYAVMTGHDYHMQDCGTVLVESN